MAESNTSWKLCKTWPGLSVKAVNKHYPDSNETQQGHMQAQRQDIRSLKIKAKAAKPEESKDQETPMTKQNDVFMKIIDTKDTIYTKQTGQYPHLSSKCNIYIMLAIHIDSNYIVMEAVLSNPKWHLDPTNLTQSTPKHKYPLPILQYLVWPHSATGSQLHF